MGDYGKGYGLIMLIFGEFNVFSPTDARFILEKAYDALAKDGHLLLEVSTFSAVRSMGEQASSWYSAESGLFQTSPTFVSMRIFGMPSALWQLSVISSLMG
jgi:hypothetical protein